MVGVMDNELLSEGLFLKNYLGTVSAVPRPRTVETKPLYGETTKQQQQNGIINHPRIIYDLGNKLEEIQVESEEKKKEKKWTFGGFFKRKNKKDADDSSDESGEENKKGFFPRRKSKRDRRKTRSKANGFDVVIPQQSVKNGEITVEQLWSGESKASENNPVRYIHRHPEGKANSLQVPKSRRDSRSSGGSENTEGRKGRKEVMARAEAKRDMMRDDSSSDEYESHHSNSSLNRMNGESRRPRRTNKRVKDDEVQNDMRMIKSDFEGRRLPPNCRWMSRTYYPDSSDLEPQKLNLMNHSGTPSPCRSPRARQKQLLHYMMMQNSYPTSTFPPGIHYQQSPGRNLYTKDIQPRNQGYRVNRNSEYNLQKSVSSLENNRKTLMDYEQFLNSCGSGKSLSYDQNIHRASYFENEADVSRKANVPNGRPAGLKTYNGVSENRTDSLPSGNFPQPTQIVRRSASGNSFCERNFYPNRSSSYQQIPGYCPQPKFPDAIPPKSQLNGTPSVLRYYADQNPRSRNPIHITCNPTTPEQPYLSDSQMFVKPVQPVRSSASDFWKLKDQELMKQQKRENALKPPPQSNPRSRSNSPRLNDIEKPETNFRKILKEEYNAAKVKTPPEPPVRRLSKQEVLARLQKCEQLKNQENEVKTRNETKVHNSNLDDALNELEAIYNSLSLKDEDLVDRAERRDLPVYRPKNPITSISVRDKIQNFYAEADYSKSPDSTTPNGHQRAIPLRRSGVPDKMTDDMAFRRLNQKDRTDVKKIPPQSYLRSSPALSPVQNPSPTFRKDSPVLEPDITFDDVVFRNIRHANSTLKIQDPQPPFGIPIGVITPAPNSDYLHATPTERFRPTFISSKTPDVVKDDLAFRNLRKDNRTNNTSLEPKNEIKKRAVRSLSANLYNIMQKDNPAFIQLETNNNIIMDKNCEKTQSLTDLTKGKNALEKRLKELKEEKNSKRAEFFELSQEARKKSSGNLSWTDLANLNGDFDSVQPKTIEEPKKFKSPIVELSKYPAAAPTSSLQGNPFKDATFDDEQLENLLSALAKEAEKTSKDLEKQLETLETKNNDKAIEEFDKKFKSVDKIKRRRNLSLSSTNETKEEIRKTGSLERRRKPEKIYPFEELCSKANRERKRSQSFEPVTDLSQILDTDQTPTETVQKDTNNVFQEVYEYNCNLEPVEVVKDTPRTPDVEVEFEKLHEEVSTKESALDELIADVTSVNQSTSDSYSSFPFPKDPTLPSGSGMLNHRNGTASGSGKGEETPSDPNDSTKRKEFNVKMFPKHKEKVGMPTSNSSSESDQKREDMRRREASVKHAPNHDSTTKSFKTTRKKEDLRGGGSVGGPFLRLYLNNQVPSSRRDGNKTDSASDEHGSGGPSPRDTVVVVRETKASRLRAASRTPTPDVGSPGTKTKKNEKESLRPSISGSPTFNSLNRKDVDKSASRKSHLNRSHTSEGVYDDVYIPGGSNIRRRRSKNPNAEPPPSKTTERTRPTMGNTNGTPKDPHELSRTSSIIRNSNRKSDKVSLKGTLTKKRPEDLDLIKPTWRSSDKSKQIDIATRAEILAASTLKMINRLDEINNKSRRSIKPEVRNPSILKNKPSVTSNTVGDPLKPVSILKRKSLSQDDAQTYSPPVTFSPSVLKKETDPKRQGILKKRRSLDENEVMRRRSYSPETNLDFKSILKTQRRSSMEELTRSRSPDTTPQSILKRKSSKEEEIEDEPQGILKRKSLPCLTCHHHSKTSDTIGDVSENVRPILKKKSSSEDHSTSDPSLSEVPKSILKKKTSVEVDEPDDKPMKPILKTSKLSSMEEQDDGRRRSLNAFEEPKPILKRENGRSEIGVVLRRVGSRHDRPHSSSDIDSELSAIFVKRRSLEFQPVAFVNFGGETKRASSNDRLKGDPTRRPLSVAEKINNLENFLEVERIERERRNSPPGTPPSDFGDGRKVDGQQKVASTISSSSLPAGRSRDISAVTQDLECGTPDEKTDEDTSSFVTASSERFSSSKSTECNDLGSTSKSQGSFLSWESNSEQQQQPKTDEKKYDTDSFYSLDSCGERISNLSLKDTTEEMMDAEDLAILQKSRSVSSKTSLFKEIESKLKNSPPTRRVPTENTAINRRQEKKLLQSNAHRYHTQPVSAEDVEQAVRKNKDEDETHEDELCTMSYKDRLRMFEATFTPKLPEPSGRAKRGVRHRTQPVTTDEVEIAKSQRRLSSTLAEGHSSGVSNLKENEKTKPKGILKNLNESKKSGSSDSSDSDKKGSELTESFQNLKKVLRKESASELKGILKQTSYEKKTSSSSEEEYEASSPKRNLAAILQKVEPVVAKGRKSSGEVAPKYMQNAGIARIINKSRNNSLIVKSQSHSSVSPVFGSPSKSPFPEGSLALNGETKQNRGNGEVPRSGKDETDESQVVRSGLRRSTTQPLGPSDDGNDDDMSGASIRERLARLKRSGELDWQKRKSHVTNVEDELSVITAGNYLFNERSLFRDKNPPSSPPQPSKEIEEFKNSSSILADRLGKLEAAAEGWKKRIKPSDAVKFSVEGKILEKRDSLSPPNAAPQISPTRTPLLERKKRSPKAARFRSKHCNPSLSSVPSSPLERIDNPIARSVSAPGSGKDGLFSLSPVELKETNGPVVSVPKYDDETFTSFFEGLTTERLFQERLEIKDEDLDAVTRMKSSQLLVQKRNIKTQKRRATVRNPVKALAARLDLQEYTEIKTGIAEKELKRMKIEKAAKHSTLAIEALAGLASQEDFTAVNLKKATEGGAPSPDAPYKPLMLLQVKGRRHVQTRLIEPIAKNINSGDCFILVTPDRVFHYIGEFANVIERSRGAEISLHIQQKGDLGCSATSVITIGEGGRASREQVKEFWKLLGGEPGCEKEIGGVDKDELYESALVDTNMVYEMINDELVPVETYWGSIPRIEVLDPNKVLIFDFGSEFYVWNGKNVNLPKRKVALKLGKELWEEGYDYTDCDLCPLTAASHLGGTTPWSEVPEAEKAGPVRPSWALFAKITQNMETVLFREKFLDWPDYSRVIRRGKNEESEGDPSGAIDVKPCDVKKMFENSVPEPDLILEGNHLGRGVRYFDEETRRCSEISTQDVKVWHVKEYEYSELPEESLGQFHMEDSYVVRWHYVITITGRELSGQPSKHLTTGRNRYAYFFWQGHDSPINDKGAAACLTVELDKEHGPQVRVVEGFEPPAFLNLFNGGMVTHTGRRNSDTPRDKLRLFICRGEIETESVLFEVPCSMRQLRSLASFVLVNRETGKVIVWHGWKSPDNNRKNALAAAKRLQSQIPEFEFKTKEITIREEVEGSESQDFIRGLGGDNRQLYHSLLHDETKLSTPRLFHLTSVSGEFLFNEISSPHLIKDKTTTLPFIQSDLYSASQPALFLLDTSYGLWLWQGWWEDEETERGSGYVRYQAERRAAMSTAISYWSLKYGSAKPKAYLIWAGLEPLIFTNQFPFWTDRDDIAEINMKDGRKPGEAVPIKTELASLTQSTYPLAQLQNRPLPDGVDPTLLEEYLEPQCFPDLFGMDKEEFLSLPSWKKKKLKQDAGLF